MPAHPPIALPVEVRRGTTTVRAEAGLESLANDVAEMAPGKLSSIYADLPGLPRPRAVEIRLVKSSADIANAAPPGRGAPEWAAGVAYADAGLVVIATRRGANSIHIESTVAHELAHLALDAAIGDRAPRWLHEGFAYLHSSDWSFERTRTLTGMAWTGDVIPLAKLDHSFPAREHAASRAYAQSYDFAAFLANRGRSAATDDDGDRWAFRAFLAALSEGDDINAAARHGFRAELPQLFSEWYETLRQRYMMLPVGMFSLLIWVIAALLLVIGYVRRRRQNRSRLAAWAIAEAGNTSASTDDFTAYESELRTDLGADFWRHNPGEDQSD